MSLVFPRLARNFVKNGYYPTDSVTMSRITQALSFSSGTCTLLDPCCGEGTALAAIKEDLINSSPESKVTAYGVEYDEERAWHSKQLLDHCIHGDLRNCVIGIRQFGLLFLNPPYGDAVADNAGLSDPKSGRLRLEKEFYRRTHGLLQFGGVMVLILPYYTLDKEFSSWIATHFKDVKIFMAPEQQFKQCVIFGIKQKVSTQYTASEAFKVTRHTLFSVGNGDLEANELPEYWNEQTFSENSDGLYHIPNSKEPDRFELRHLDSKQLAHSLNGQQGLWKQFNTIFNHNRTMDLKRPLCDVSNWHLSLMLAAGQVSGVVNSKDGRTFVVRGDTYKDKKVTTTNESGSLNEAGSYTEGRTVRTHTDIFVPAIRGLDMTPGSDTFGDVFIIK